VATEHFISILAFIDPLYIFIHPKLHIHVKKSFVWKHEYEAKDV